MKRFAKAIQQYIFDPAIHLPERILRAIGVSAFMLILILFIWAVLRMVIMASR